MSLRVERLKELIREVASNTILFELHDPRIGFCTVTKIDLAKDLSSAIIYVSILEDEVGKRTTMRGLTEARGVVQSRIAGAMNTRVTPQITIELDETIEKNFRILEKIREARASDPDGGEGSLDEDQIPEDA